MITSIVRDNISIGNLPGKIWHGPCYNSLSEMNASFSFLKDNDVSVIWNLLEDDTVAKLEAKSFYVIHTPVNDFSTPQDPESFRSSAKRIINLLKTGRNIYIHCMGGHGRTGMAILYLMVMIGENPIESTSLVKSLVKGPETEMQTIFATQQCLPNQDRKS